MYFSKDVPYISSTFDKFILWPCCHQWHALATLSPLLANIFLFSKDVNHISLKMLIIFLPLLTFSSFGLVTINGMPVIQLFVSKDVNHICPTFETHPLALLPSMPCLCNTFTSRCGYVKSFLVVDICTNIFLKRC